MNKYLLHSQQLHYNKYMIKIAQNPYSNTQKPIRVTRAARSSKKLLQTVTNSTVISVNRAVHASLSELYKIFGFWKPTSQAYTNRRQRVSGLTKQCKCFCIHQIMVMVNNPVSRTKSGSVPTRGRG